MTTSKMTASEMSPAGAASSVARAPSRTTAKYAAHRIEGTQAVLDLIAAHETTSTALAFQRQSWLRPIYENLAADLGATAVAVCVANAVSGDLAMVLPLIQQREGGLTVVTWASLGVSDYGAPLLGPAAPETAREAEALWKAVKRALAGVDTIELANMPAMIAGRVNPLARLSACLPSRHQGHTLTLTGSVEAFLASRGKKYRKEAERCGRLLADMGTVEFRRAETQSEIAAAYATLETQQRDRHAGRGSGYRLNEHAYARFFREALVAGTASGAVHIFTLKAGAETAAVLYGISHAGTFTLLRISTGGEAWKRASPGRLIVLETMRYFLSHGVSTFDMGIGDYDFKHGFGVEVTELTDAISALTLRGTPRTGALRLKAKIRQFPALASATKQMLGRN